MHMITACLPRHVTGLLPALLTLAACAWSTRPAELESANPQRLYRIVGWQSYTSHARWVNSPYYRIEDAGAEYPIQIVVREDGWACLVPPRVFALNPPRVGCSYWRAPRPGARFAGIEPRF